MRTIAHISDLHFGRHDEAAIAALGASLAASRPTVVVVTGDLTQRAKREEFARARDFLASLGAAVVVVPGNHDVPLYAVWNRFLRPFARYRRYIDEDLEPGYVDDEVAVFGLNTARSLTFQNGRISFEQMDAMRRRFTEAGERRFKVLASHHPFVPNPAVDGATVRRGARALAVLEDVGAQLLLTGHLHVGHSEVMAAVRPTMRRCMLVVQAGTATSTRLRGEANEYNLLTIDPPRVRCEARAFDGRAFTPIEIDEYRLSGGCWQRPDPVPDATQPLLRPRE